MFLMFSKLGQGCAHVCGDGGGVGPPENKVQRGSQEEEDVCFHLLGGKCLQSEKIGDLEYKGHRDFCNCNRP